MSEGSKTVAGAYAEIANHEKLCAERYQGIRDDINEIKSSQKDMSKAAWGVAIALLAWGASQVYSDLKSHAPPVPVVQSVLPDPG